MMPAALPTDGAMQAHDAGNGTGRRRVLVLTSCTGEKAVAHARQLTIDDFRRGLEHVRRREQELADLLRPAAELYTGQQHIRLMRGVRALREQVGHGDASVELDVRIVSAGYGLVRGARRLAPYEATFQKMPKVEARQWAARLGIPADVRAALAERFDLGLVLLSDDYLDVCALDEDLSLGGPVLVLCGTVAARRLPTVAGMRALPLKEEDTRRFGAGLVALKGEVAGRLLERIASEPDMIAALAEQGTDPLALVVGAVTLPRKTRQRARANQAVDYVVEIPPWWWAASHARPLAYFIPETDDLVDPEYDFEADEPSHGAANWSNQVYAHQLYGVPNADGILVSRFIVEKARMKQHHIREMGGIHRYLRVPNELPLLGDCGAFGYIGQPAPPYSTADTLDFYTELGFTHGVSVDHLVVGTSGSERQARYDLTRENALAFIQEHRRRGLAWEPVGAIQGWDAASYVAAARTYVAAGYRWLALGGMIRMPTPQILRIVAAVREVVPAQTRIHLFGIGRLAPARDFVRAGVTSVDSASPLRRAWLRPEVNLLTERGWFSTVRIPEVSGNPWAAEWTARGTHQVEHLRELENRCLRSLRAFARGRGAPPPELVEQLVEYDLLLPPGSPRQRRTNAADSFRKQRPVLSRLPERIAERVRRTLEERPWERCRCPICHEIGVEVAIFRGNNRNRRRGFHNVHVFYTLLGRALDGETIPWLKVPAEEMPGGGQLPLFEAY